jgi:hypothetical protein
VEIDAILCDYVQAADGKLFVNGGGIMRSWVSPEPPHMITLGLGAVVQVPYTETNQPHTFRIDLLDEDGHPVIPFAAEGTPDPGPIEAEVSFNLGRPPGLSHGEAQPYTVAANFTIGLRQLGGYTFRISIDGKPEKALSLRVATAPPTMGIIHPGMPTAM